MIYNVTTGATYSTIAAAARATGINPGSISRASRKPSLSAGGYQWAVASTKGEKIAASNRARAAERKLSESRREKRRESREAIERGIEQRKEAEKRAKEQAAAEERARKAAERERKRQEREHKQAVADARRAIKALKRKRKEANLSNQISGMLDQMIEQIGIDDFDELDELSTETLAQIAGRASQTFESIAAIEGREDVGRLQLLFGLPEHKAIQYQQQLRDLLSEFGEIRQFVTSVQGEAGYAAIRLKSAYDTMVLKSSGYTEQNLDDLIATLRGVIDEAKRQNYMRSDAITKTISEWAKEAKVGHKKPRTPLKRRY